MMKSYMTMFSLNFILCNLFARHEVHPFVRLLTTIFYCKSRNKFIIFQNKNDSILGRIDPSNGSFLDNVYSVYIEFHGFLDSWNTILVCPKKGRLTCGLNSWTTVVTAMENLADLYYYAKKINMPDATLLSCLPFKHNLRLELYIDILYYETLFKISNIKQ